MDECRSGMDDVLPGCVSFRAGAEIVDQPTRFAQQPFMDVETVEPCPPSRPGACASAYCPTDGCRAAGQAPRSRRAKFDSPRSSDSTRWAPPPWFGTKSTSRAGKTVPIVPNDQLRRAGGPDTVPTQENLCISNPAPFGPAVGRGRLLPGCGRAPSPRRATFDSPRSSGSTRRAPPPWFGTKSTSRAGKTVPIVPNDQLRRAGGPDSLPTQENVCISNPGPFGPAMEREDPRNLRLSLRCLGKVEVPAPPCHPERIGGGYFPWRGRRVASR
jgi:hypothetical protein